jgi:hypothetical protein
MNCWTVEDYTHAVLNTVEESSLFVFGLSGVMVHASTCLAERPLT